MNLLAPHRIDTRRGLLGLTTIVCLLGWLVLAQPALAEEPVALVEAPAAASPSGPDVVPVQSETPVVPVQSETPVPTDAVLPTDGGVPPHDLPRILPPDGVQVSPPAPITPDVPVTPDVPQGPSVVIVDEAPPAPLELAPPSGPEAPAGTTTPGLGATTTPLASPDPTGVAASPRTVEAVVAALPEAPPDLPAPAAITPGGTSAPVAPLAQKSDQWAQIPAPLTQDEAVVPPAASEPPIAPFVSDAPSPVSFVVPSGGFLQLLVAYIAPGDLGQTALPPLTQLLMVLVAWFMIRPRSLAERIASRSQNPRPGHHGLVLQPG